MRFTLFISLWLLTLNAVPALAVEECKQALVEKVSGKLLRLPEQAASEPILGEGDLFAVGEGFRTGPKTYADLRLCDGSAIRVGAETEIEFEDQAAETPDFLLTRGALRVVLAAGGKVGAPRLRLRSPSASVGGRTGEFLLEVAGESPRASALHVLRGESLLGPEAGWGALHGVKEQTVPDGFTLVATNQTAAIESGEKAASAAEKFERNKLIRERNKGAAATLFGAGLRATGAKETGAIYKRAEAKRRKNLTPEQREKLEAAEKAGK